MSSGYASPGKTLHRQRDVQAAFARAFAPIRNGELPPSAGLRDVQTQVEAASREG
jgi:hypothetical protein